jgi:hypothetical protein
VDTFFLVCIGTMVRGLDEEGFTAGKKLYGLVTVRLHRLRAAGKLKSYHRCRRFF